MQDDQYDDPHYPAQQQQYPPYEDYDNLDDSYEIEQQQYYIIPQSSLFSQLSQTVNIIKTMVGLQFGWCILLFNQFKWNLSILQKKYLQNPQYYKTLIGYNSKLKNSQAVDVTKKQICCVCCEQENLIAYICNHQFCANCWEEHINQNVKTGNVLFKCMGCETPMLYESVIKILDLVPKDCEKVKKKYIKRICELYITVNNQYQCCIGVDCTNVIKTSHLTLTTVKCNCGKSFCFYCKSDDHSPCTCQQRNKWTDLVLKQDLNSKWISLNTKICPWCKKAVERSQGCNFMACLCGKSFCYVCSRPWQPDHSDHFNCHIYKPNENDIEKIQNQKVIFEKLNFYVDRYLNSQAISNQLTKVNIKAQRQIVSQVLQIQWMDTEFILESNKFAIECCNSVKWIYAYNYFVIFPSRQKKEFFEFNQGNYQMYKQTLLNLLSIKLKKFVDDLKVCKDNGLMIEKESKLQSYKKLKIAIIDCFHFTKSFKEKFITEIEKMDVKMIQGLNKKFSIETPNSLDMKTSKVKKYKKPN